MIKKICYAIIALMPTFGYADYKVYGSPQNNGGGKVIDVPKPAYLTGCIYDANNYWGFSTYKINASGIYYKRYNADGMEISQGYLTSPDLADINRKYMYFEGVKYEPMSSRSQIGQFYTFSVLENWNLQDNGLGTTGILYRASGSRYYVASPFEIGGNNYNFSQGSYVETINGAKRWEICYEVVQ